MLIEVDAPVIVVVGGEASVGFSPMLEVIRAGDAECSLGHALVPHPVGPNYVTFCEGDEAILQRVVHAGVTIA